MSAHDNMPGRLATIAIGPVMPGWGSWDWVGADLVSELANDYRILTYGPGETPVCDLQLVIKHPGPCRRTDSSVHGPSIVYCPIDFYGGPNEIDADRVSLPEMSVTFGA
jgi:hypothetical protein